MPVDDIGAINTTTSDVTLADGTFIPASSTNDPYVLIKAEGPLYINEPFAANTISTKPLFGLIKSILISLFCILSLNKFHCNKALFLFTLVFN